MGRVLGNFFIFFPVFYTNADIPSFYDAVKFFAKAIKNVTNYL